MSSLHQKEFLFLNTCPFFSFSLSSSSNFFSPLNAATQVDYVETELKKITSNAAVLQVIIIKRFPKNQQ